MASEREEGDAGSSEEVKVKVGWHYLRSFVVLVNVARQLSEDDDSSVEEGQDGHDTDVTETAHVFD